MRPAPRSGAAAIGRMVAWALAITFAYAGLAVAFLRPLFSDPAHGVVAAGPFSQPDVNLIMWVMAWDWHALTRAPSTLFDANIFYPARNALACSEHMLGHLPIFGPVYGLTGNPVLANQCNVLAAFALSGTAMYALLRYLGVERSAAFFGGFVYAFAPVRTGRIAHAHLIATQYLPLAILFLDRTLRTASPWSALGLAITAIIQMLCSYYLAYMTVFALGGYAVGSLIAYRRVPVRAVLLVLAAGVAAGLPLLYVSRPYLGLGDAGVIPDYGGSVWVTISSSGAWRNFLYPPIALRAWGFKLDRGFSLYLGFIPIGLALVALVGGSKRSSPGSSRSRAGAVGSIVACYLMALGPEIRLAGHALPGPFAVATRFVPGFSAIRVPARFGLALMVGVAALAALGLTSVLRATEGVDHRRRWLARIVLAVAVIGTALEYDLPIRDLAIQGPAIGKDLPPVYRALASVPPGPVLEIPIAYPNDLKAARSESEYMLYSTYHWHPLLNGYSGYRPLTFAPILALVGVLPEARATETLARISGLRYVIVHLASLPIVDRAKWLHPPGLRLIDRYGSDVFFTLSDSPPTDLLGTFLDSTNRSRTVFGTPMTSLPELQQRAGLDLESASKRVARAGEVIDVALTVTNRSEVTWPALSANGSHLVTLAARWLDEAGNVIEENSTASRLPYDLGPGESSRAIVRATMPTSSKTMATGRLVLGVAQDGKWFEDPLPAITVAVAK